MPAHVSEAFILRTWPLKEADLIVSFFTRDQGKMRGVAKRARRPKSPFGASLERLSQVRAAYFQRETRELVNLDSCEIVRSPFALLSDYDAAIALDFIAEIADHLLPPSEAGERFFRLLAATLDHLHGADPGRLRRAATYFSLWAARLSGFLPELHVCLGCGVALEGEGAFFTRERAGLLCRDCRPRNAWELSGDSARLADLILRTPIAQVAPGPWARERGADLRRFLAQQIETHIERRLVTAAALDS
jgi:DNA repair protein RecO (recombination protein O)